MPLRAFQSEDLPAVTALWNRCWADAPRRLTITEEDFARRVLAVPTMEATTLLVAEEASAGFVHFGPRETWGFLLEDRATPDGSVGVIYALCADEDAVRETLLRAAETGLRAAGAHTITLWPTWAQGTMAFYTGLTPSTEVSGLWEGSPQVAWAETQGYSVVMRYRLGELPLKEDGGYPPIPEGAEAMVEPFPASAIPGAQKLFLRYVGSRVEIGRVIYVGAEERNRLLGTRECAAFDVAVAPAYRGQGWGRAMMGEMARQALREGYTTLQLHVTAGNTPAENLYFRSLGFLPVPAGNFVTLRQL